MSSQNILTYGSKTFIINLINFSPILTMINYNTEFSSLYFFLSKVDPWLNNSILTPSQDQNYLKKILNNIFITKKISIKDISPVVSRVDWSKGITYDYYDDKIDMFALDNSGNNLLNFYVKNKYDQVFKCLWNNNGNISTDEPFIEPGSFRLNDIYFGSDGYKWKYLYTIDGYQKNNFMDSNWIPVPATNKILNPLVSDVGYGSIDVINVLYGGEGYNSHYSVVTVNIEGDGTDAAAYAQITGNTISDIIVTNPGKNYTYSNVTVSSTLGSNTLVTSPVSPIGGHGFDPVSELGCRNVMFAPHLDGTEIISKTSNLQYYTLGIICNPVALSSTPNHANSTIYKTTTNINVSSGTSNFEVGETVYVGTNLTNSSYSGVVVNFDDSTNLLNLTNTYGNLSLNDILIGNNSGTSRSVLSISQPDYQKISGQIIYFENREGINVDIDGIDQLRLIIGL